MTIRRKLTISNICMIVIPAFLSLLFALFLLHTVGYRYWDSLEDMFQDQNAVYSAQSIIYSSKADFFHEEWAEYARVEDGQRVLVTKNADKMKEMDQELKDLGYHFRICIDGEVAYSSLTETEENKLSEYFEDTYTKIGSMTLSDEDASMIKNTFTAEQETVVIDAVCLSGSGAAKTNDSYLKKHIVIFLVLFLIFVFAVVILTNLILSRYITHMILKPLNALRSGTKEIADGNLDFQLDYLKKDEFGDVCKEFDQMRGHLKDSVETRLRYEQYRQELIVGISHDLRTPLTSIKGYVEGLKDGIANTEDKKKRYYDAIHVRALDMEALVDSLSTFAKLENKEHRYRLESVNMNEYMRQLIGEYTEEAKQKRAIILYDNQASNTAVKLDVQEMHRVFINLFENSIKYRNRDESVIRILLENHEDMLQIRVSDDGPGVPDNELDKIFNSFYRGDESRTNPASGSGLGLAIVKQIVEGHHGTIHAMNENGLVMIIEIHLKAAERDGGED